MKKFIKIRAQLLNKTKTPPRMWRWRDKTGSVGWCSFI